MYVQNLGKHFLRLEDKKCHMNIGPEIDYFLVTALFILTEPIQEHSITLLDNQLVIMLARDVKV